MSGEVLLQKFFKTYIGTFLFIVRIWENSLYFNISFTENVKTTHVAILHIKKLIFQKKLSTLSQKFNRI